mmetsp:Transcript_14047/g.33307  ORF Transcript_14047/g.33307 Transcript_14047/m.33307 type:complete len:198 (+) Transcript_14047:92-685(+)|eukprot:CAMPEP_0172588876 /NCGR_PEP_ID=MMETSP1068-20121228/7710_1 /TAXON_ID=35684 /ORGANISM="Pseudopedinella elastica, Strain CCMP716" /LENGTH=197 /DNA_ID=CAMNT_0013384335 /DNA_START=91 /DNA_END=684 /DNA_ORIENTATION=+
MGRKMKIPEVTVEPEEALGLIELMVAVFTIAYVLSGLFHHFRKDLKWAVTYGLNLIEAGLWAAVFSVLAIWGAAVPELLFSKYIFTPEVEGKKWPQLLFEVVLQAAANGAVSQVVVDLAKKVPVPDLGEDKKALSASTGGVIFGFLQLSRQNAWKAKIAGLDKLLDASFMMGLPVPFIKLLGFLEGGLPETAATAAN